MGKLEVIQGDITELEVDAIVNANNTNLLGYAEGNGVNGKIIEKGGDAVSRECKKVIIKMGTLAPGEAILTTAGNLPAKHIIHTVGPVWNGGKSKEEMILTDCYDNALHLAAEKGLSSIAFPNISTGFYKFPKNIAAEIAVGTCLWFLKQEKAQKIETIYLVCHNDENYKLCKQELEKNQS
ncbi:macro domain-containing protein [Chondrinema litorale]|uniref:macro domain-containing protein n=1 Tax=Chondrinema litorale TaxID=2994555 RepID=UPI002542AECC|nr:macro domain-containing protein [Chondrinema litorale]UZR94512.1 macro domain-containing protein [Chondrinema litorale]